MIIESVREYMESLDCMREYNKAINVNYLAEDIDNFSIEESPTAPIIKRYANGSSIRAYDFSFNSREIYGIELLQNIANSNFYEELLNEIEAKNDIGDLPKLDKGLSSIGIEVTSSPYIVSNDEESSIYQINLRLKYFKEA